MERLHREGYFILQLWEVTAPKGFKTLLHTFRRARLEELAAFSREFAVMIRAGIPILETLETLRLHMKPGLLRSALEQVQKEVEGGHSLSEAMRKQPQVFPRLYVNLVRAAEAGGNLDQILKRAADYLSASLALQRRVKSALMYPTVIFIATLFTFAYMMTFIMPKFAEMFNQMNVALPFTTKILVMLGELGNRYKVLVLLSPLLILIGGFAAWQSPRVREPLSYWISRLPLIGDLTHKVVLTQVLTALQTLLSAGVMLARALEIAAEVAGDLRMAKVLAHVRVEVEGGRPLAECLKGATLFPPLVIQLVAAGEKTGALPEMLGEIVAFYEDEVEQKLKGLTSILEPMLVLFLGVLIGIFAMSIISPIYSLMGTIK